MGTAKQALLRLQGPLKHDACQFSKVLNLRVFS
jgi:hypothetical protein